MRSETIFRKNFIVEHFYFHFAVISILIPTVSILFVIYYNNVMLFNVAQTLVENVNTQNFIHSILFILCIPTYQNTEFYFNGPNQERRHYKLGWVGCCISISNQIGLLRMDIHAPFNIVICILWSVVCVFSCITHKFSRNTHENLIKYLIFFVEWKITAYLLYIRLNIMTLYRVPIGSASR